jgi:GNAT superfamily N-acetyltransferase
MPAKLAIRSRADAPHLKKAASAIEQAAWSNVGYLSYTRAHYEYYAELLDAYPEYQLCLVDEETDYPVAVASGVPFACSGPDDLPPEGWDWVVETAARTKDTRANMLGALAVSVPAVHRSKGYARVMIRALIELAESKGLDGVVSRCARRPRFGILGCRSQTTWPGPTNAGSPMTPGFAAIYPSAASWSAPASVRWSCMSTSRSGKTGRKSVLRGRAPMRWRVRLHR